MRRPLRPLHGDQEYKETRWSLRSPILRLRPLLCFSDSVSVPLRFSLTLYHS